MGHPTTDKCGHLASALPCGYHFLSTYSAKNAFAIFQKGGDPAAPSDTATLLRLHPSHEPRRGKRPPYG